MKKYFLFFSLLIVAINIHAQRTNDAKLEDSIFAWKPVPKLKATEYTRTFSTAQLKHPELFAQWFHKSYTPVGALDFSYAVAEPNKKEEVQPYGVGLCAAMWRAMWDNAGTKVIKTPHTESRNYVLTNTIIDAEPIRMLTIPGHSVFMRRSADMNKAFMGNSNNKNAFIKNLKLQEHPQIGKYIVQYYGCDGDGCQPLVAVYLAPNNKLPIRQLTRGEVLNMIEQAIPAETTVAKNKLKSTYGHRPQSLQEEYKRFDETVLPKWKSNLEALRKKYSNRLDEPAELKNQNGIEMINIFNGDDIFDTEQQQRMKLNTYGVYTYENGVLEKSKQDQPLWLCISWVLTDQNSLPYQQEIHRSMITHFNFDYAYNYFFQPELVKNKPYNILNEAAQQSKLTSFKKATTNSKVQVKKKSSNDFYFEDFANGIPGQKPTGWYANSVGKASLIAKPGDEKNNWLQLGDNKVMPDDFGKSLPENFKMEFDVFTDGDFTPNTGGAFRLRIHNKILRPQGDYTDAPKQIFIDLEAQAANAKFTQNPTGFTRLKATYTGMNSIVRYADVLQYSNEFSNVKNKVKFTITKQGNAVRGFIDGQEIIALDKNRNPIPGFNELPAGTRFTSFYFENISSKKEVGIYVSNIKIEAL